MTEQKTHTQSKQCLYHKDPILPQTCIVGCQLIPVIAPLQTLLKNLSSTSKASPHQCSPTDHASLMATKVHFILWAWASREASCSN
eukprot:Gb_02372 [translate_table: standard]